MLTNLLGGENMNTGRAGSPARIDGKIQALKEELEKEEEEQNKCKIERLKESIKRNKKIAKHISRKKKRKN